MLFVSVDPERDDPGRLRDYLEFFDPSFIGATASHAVLDIPYMAADSSNLYAHPVADFCLEVGILLACAWLFQRRARLNSRRRLFFFGVVGCLAMAQGAWNSY